MICVFFGLVDFSAILFFVLPVFARQRVSYNSELIIKSANLFVLYQNFSPASLMLATVSAISILFGAVELAFQNTRKQKVKAILFVKVAITINFSMLRKVSQM